MDHAGDDLLKRAYREARVGEHGCLRPEHAATLEDFQDAYAAAYEWESMGLIKVLSTADPTDASFVLPIRFQRVK